MTNTAPCHRQPGFSLTAWVASGRLCPGFCLLYLALGSEHAPALGLMVGYFLDVSQQGQSVCVCTKSFQVVSNSLRTHGLYPARLLCPWDSPGKYTGVGHQALLQGIFPTQGWNLVSCVSCIGRRGFFCFLFITSTTWEAQQTERDIAS